MKLATTVLIAVLLAGCATTMECQLPKPVNQIEMMKSMTQADWAEYFRLREQYREVNRMWQDEQPH
jgi:uncharacterized protein YceK